MPICTILAINPKVGTGPKVVDQTDRPHDRLTSFKPSLRGQTLYAPHHRSAIKSRSLRSWINILVSCTSWTNRSLAAKKHPWSSHGAFFFPKNRKQLNRSTFSSGLACLFYFPEKNHCRKRLPLLCRVIQAYCVSWRAVIRSFHHVRWPKELMGISWPQTTDEDVNKLLQKCLNSMSS